MTRRRRRRRRYRGPRPYAGVGIFGPYAGIGCLVWLLSVVAAMAAAVVGLA
jgi:hypothetical protein